MIHLGLFKQENKPCGITEEKNMNRVELVAEVAKKADLSKKDAEAAVKSVFDAIADALAEGDKVQLIGFGTFDVAERAAREGRNPRTGETMKIEASKAPRFKAGKALKDKIN
ncbi:MAG: HU family DNA-binding protein [Oribacterium sp.]|nr:HU family DNA-binding protein [Oribacterium sp.]